VVEVAFALVSSLNSISIKLDFRDRIWTYTQGYLAADAVEEAAAATMINAEECGSEEGNVDGMRLVQLLLRHMAFTTRHSLRTNN
jgi:hypothetical protein